VIPAAVEQAAQAKATLLENHLKLASMEDTTASMA
jgi:hypothetical protein